MTPEVTNATDIEFARITSGDTRIRTEMDYQDGIIPGWVYDDVMELLDTAQRALRNEDVKDALRLIKHAAYNLDNAPGRKMGEQRASRRRIARRKQEQQGATQA